VLTGLRIRSCVILAQAAFERIASGMTALDDPLSAARSRVAPGSQSANHRLVDLFSSEFSEGRLPDTPKRDSI
jgi:hypothetical protein